MPYMVCQEYKSLVTAEVNTTIFAVYFWSQIFRRAKKVVITPADTGPCYTTFSDYCVTVKHITMTTKTRERISINIKKL